MSKIGIVFVGGGGKGAYQIGVWKALDELSLCHKIKAVSGTSVGALNGAMFCTQKLDSAVSAWSNISEKAILSREFVSTIPDAIKNYRKGIVHDSWFSNNGLKKMIEQYLDLTAIKNSKIVFFACASKISKDALLYNSVKSFSQKNILHKIISTSYLKLLKTVSSACYFNVQQYDEDIIQDIILSSAAIPLIFPDIIIDDDIYVDGGLQDNVPIAPLYNAGFDKIFIVDLDSESTISTEKFPNSQFLRLSLHENNEFQNMKDTFNFTAKNAAIKMEKGYNDCINIADRVIKFFN